VAEDRAAARTAKGSGAARGQRRQGRAAHGRARSGSGGARRGRAWHGAAGSGAGSGDGGGTERRQGREAPPLRSSPPARPSLIDANDLSWAVAATGEEEGVFIPPRLFSPGWCHQPGLKSL
jgi:hypothetical protein